MQLRQYIIKQLLYWLVVSAASLIGIVWLSQALKLIELIINKGAPLADFITLTALAIPLWLMTIIPIAGLLATVIVLNKLQQDREINAMNSAGLSNLKIAQTPLAFGIIISIAMLLNSAYILPLTFSGYKSIINNIRTSSPIITLQEGVFADLTPGLTVFIEQRNGQNNFSDIFVHDTRDPNKIIEIYAQSGNINLNENPPKFNFANGTRSEYSPQNKQANLLEFGNYSLTLTRQYQDLVPPPSDYNELSIPTLLQGNGATQHFSQEMMAEGHYRIAAPILGITLVIVGTATILSPRYSRTSSWRQISAAIFFSMIILIALIAARGATITTPSLFPLMYIITIAPTLIALLLMRQPAKPLKAQADV